MQDPAMKKVTELYDRSGLTLDELGQAMGYAPDAARKSTWQFLKRTDDPRISMLRRFAKAMGISIQELVTEFEPEKKKAGRK
jgi:transcriptional regulator with XRE-family HTH domain